MACAGSCGPGWAGAGASLRFAGRIRVDCRANAVFAHADQDGPCGYEIKNRGFVGFARGGDKGLWFPAARAGGMTLVIAEGGIDARSYAALDPDAAARSPAPAPP